MTRATPTETTPTRTTPSPSALERAIAPVETERFLAEHWEQKPLVVPREEEGRFDDLLSARDVERLITETGIRTPGFRLVKAGATVSGYTTDLAWRPAAFTGVADVRARARGVRSRRHDRPPGAASPLAAARPLLPAARGVPRPSRAGERLLHAERVTGSARPPRHARGDLASGRGREALARLRAGARPAAEEPALQVGARCTRRPGAGRGAARGRHDVPAARLAPPGAHLRLRLAPHHRRRQRPPLDRRGPRRARRAGGRHRLPPHDRRRRAAGAAVARRGRGLGTARATASCAAGDRSSTVSSPSCARSTGSASTPSSNGETP